jgi:phosphorylase kinase alpha/beta subunit
MGCRIGTEITHDSTAGERSFALLVESELINIASPEYRFLNIELMETLIKVFRDNQELNVDDDLTLDVIIGHAVRLHWQSTHSGAYDEQRQQAWSAFYQQSPQTVSEAFVESIWHLLTSA